MTELLSGIEGVVCYFDDILLHTPSTEEHKRLVARVHERLKEVGLQLNNKTCEYFKKEIQFLGYIVSENGVRPDLVKVEAIQKMATPSNVTELRRFLGMINFLGRYLPNLSTIIRPISELLEKEKTWVWGEPQKTAFEKFKNLIGTETENDVNLKSAVHYTISGWPKYKDDVPLAARDMFAVRGELCVVEGILVKGNRIVIPFSMGGKILDRIHDGHLGITKCRERANQCVWWPQISKQIQEMVAACRFCLEKQPSHSTEPLLTTTLPDRPFQMIGVDICEFKGNQNLITVDYYSRYIDIAFLSQITLFAVICKMKMFFAHHGISETVVSDNGRQFVSAEFRKFATDWNFKHVTTSSYYPQANGTRRELYELPKRFLNRKTCSSLC
ncbi:uncharacterized protein K02A2.6-like [Gigantopelta aegis]|uniref:uncharacterized protein K02A2.6-like n=1 Tax=Gigantopelta aegis TaxID=1735272 RepID=UPI001B889F07|nr:uncharacterized protein K02A2.6-like [Gigantopelta aegis]